MHTTIRAYEVWQELQAAVDKLPAARHQARRIRAVRGAEDHPTACTCREQVCM